jgi:diguanylate cyclase (GGDEF)-like protein/PAS domain S-box-containing protein
MKAMPSDSVMMERMKIINQCMKDAMDEKNPDASIRKFISEIGTMLRCLSIHIYKLEGIGNYRSSYCWRADGKPVSEKVRVLSVDELLRGRMDDFLEGKPVVLEGKEELRPFYPFFVEEKQSLSSIILSPIVRGKELTGFVTFVNPDRSYGAPGNQLFEMETGFLAIMLRHKEISDDILNSSTHDKLTGVLSINAFWNYVTPLIREIRENPKARKMAVVFMDIRHFKIINGTMGHAAGDRLLKEMGQTISFFADTNAVARALSDQFYLCVPDEAAEGIVRRIHDYMEKESEIHCDVKAGIYCLTGKEISASLAAGRAKMAGDSISENRYSYFRRYDEEMGKRLIMESYVTGHIDEAIEKGWIKVYYHPIISLLDGAISSFEALARWDDPVRGLLSPPVFIGPLEESRLLYKLDLYVIEKVCRQLAADRDAGRVLSPVSVNLSRHDLELPDLHEKINSFMESYGLDPHLLQIEITESALINNEEIIQNHIRRFHREGRKVWLDDFGSGYSSLNAVQTFDFDVLKIDMQFLRNQNDKTPAILTDIVDLAKRTGMLVLSEGVETRKQYDFLRNIGCVLAQGFYFTKPLPHEECLRVMKEKGYHQETGEDRAFYEQIGRTNVLYPLYSEDRENGIDTGSAVPTAILVTEGEKITPIYMNHAFLTRTDLDWMHDASGDWPDLENANFLRIRECLSRIQDIGEYAYAVFTASGFTRILKCRKIARDAGRKAYFAALVNPEYSLPAMDSRDHGIGPVSRDNIWNALMDSETLHLYWKDRDRKYLGANRAFLELFQKSIPDLLGKRFEEIMDSPITAEVAEIEQKVLDTGISIHDIMTIPLPGGKLHQIMISIAPIYHEGRITGLTGQSLDITSIEEECRSLAQEILKDPLTGIPNQRGFNRLLGELAHDKSIEQAYIIHGDINKFKSFNDRYGHTVGDILLKEFAREAVKLAGKEGAVSRNGGDEFQFFFKNPAPGTIKKLEEFFNRDHEFRVGGILYTYTISGGIAIYPDMGRNVQDLYDKADIALYHAKLDPHHNIALYNELMNKESRVGVGLSFTDLAAGEPASILIYRYDETEEILYANDNCLKLFECDDMQEFMKLTKGSFKTLIHPDDMEATEKAIYLQQGHPDNEGYDFILYRVLTRDGKEKEIMDIGRKIHDPYYGDLFYVLLWDNKELLRMFRESNAGSIQKQEEHSQNDYNQDELAEFLKNLPGGMHRSYLSKPSHLEWCSPGLIRMLGYEEKEFHELVGSDYTRIMAKEDWGSFAELGRRLSVKPDIGSCFYHLISKDGKRIPCIEVMQSALGGDGIMYGYSNVMDISLILRDIPLSDIDKK